MNEDDVFIIINQKFRNFYQGREMQNILTSHDSPGMIILLLSENLPLLLLKVMCFH